MSQFKVYDLRNILCAMPDDHKLFINGRALESIELNMNKEAVFIKLRGETDDERKD